MSRRRKGYDASHFLMTFADRPKKEKNLRYEDWVYLRQWLKFYLHQNRQSKNLLHGKNY